MIALKITGAIMASGATFALWSFQNLDKSTETVLRIVGILGIIILLPDAFASLQVFTGQVIKVAEHYQRWLMTLSRSDRSLALAVTSAAIFAPAWFISETDKSFFEKQQPGLKGLIQWILILSGIVAVIVALFAIMVLLEP